ncbi:hypothetical protein [Sphingomonas quercus]|uniref:ATP-binding protein n=1 Tax=Sphingomonas quercus TaxID=2842451 RepID=A0ABS6BKN6_9SPHN|nr:hypothetical protein [Sphingomonas quercus]MBU3078856.1 hypothetical protein [Sphingomonas quercus]
MFEITGEDVARLGDADLRTLVARLALAELASQGLPQSAVTAGGHQDARDGGIDVRVEVLGALAAADFVPRPVTGFQVKRPDMPASEIMKEMRPEPAKELRPAIARLAERDGAYIIVSAQGSVADQPLIDRRQAIRDALTDCADADKLHTDFYDRERLATWANRYPGAAAWVRARVGAPMTGWRAIGAWSNTEVVQGHPYLVSDEAKVIGERTGGRDELTILQALDTLREKLSMPRQCIRLIGRSGVGKTRFVEALFEPGVGAAAPLDPAFSVYTDFDEDIAPSTREMARRLVEAGQRAILVIDNCNPATHSELATICNRPGSQISLLTVEYDVRDDEPERTEVFRLVTTSKGAIETWLHREFPHVSQVDRGTIAQFSDGNFRVARALAGTVGRGETLGRLRSQELFERLFVQRNAPDHQLLRDAEALALVYSFDGEDDGPSGELANLGTLAGRSVRELFGAVAELRGRGIIQSRGRWRAVLPQAIANRLAASALARIPPRAVDGFWRSASARQLKSFARRIGYLHDSAEAREVVGRWLNPDGPLGNLFELGDIGLDILRGLAPASPKVVLAAMHAELDGARGERTIATSNRSRSGWIRLLKALAYESGTFEAAAKLLARFVWAEPEGHNSDPAREPFAELFHIHLSGTRASPEQRRGLAKTLIASGDATQMRAGAVALGALLKTSLFSSHASFDFGARPRDFGWHPTTRDEIDAWYNGAIDLAVDTAPVLPEASSLLGSHIRGIWHFAGCHDRIEAAAERFRVNGSWIDGWIGLRGTHRWDGNGQSSEERGRLEALIRSVEPKRLLERARAVVLSHSALGFDITDGDEADPVQAYHRASDTAIDLGKAMATEHADLPVFLGEVFAGHAARAFEFGCGLAAGSNDPRATWDLLTSAFAAAGPGQREISILGGFVSALHRSDAGATNAILEETMRDEELRHALPFLQSRAALDREGLDRLRRVAAARLVEAEDFSSLACGVVEGTQPDLLVEMLDVVSRLDRGSGVALDILHTRLMCEKDSGVELPAELTSYGRALLCRADFGLARAGRDYRLGALVEYCFAGPDAADDARILCQRLVAAIRAYEIYVHDSHYFLTALFKTQPLPALDCVLDNGVDGADEDMFEVSVSRTSPLDQVPAAMLVGWADQVPERRYPRLGAAMSIFVLRNLDEVTGLSDHFIGVMAHAPDKAAFLGSPFNTVHPRGWVGSLVANLEHRKSVLAGLEQLGDAQVNAWLIIANRTIDNWIAAERERENAQEESFE